MQRYFVGFCLLVLFSINERGIYACDCVNQARTAWVELKQSDVVFVGKVVDIRKEKVPSNDGMAFYYELSIKIKVIKALKNVWVSEVRLRTGASGGACSFPFKKGEKYLVYANCSKDRLQTNICTKTKLLSDAYQDFKEIEAQDEGDTLKSPESEMPPY